MKKRITAFITVIFMMIPMVASAFWDAENHWARDYIDTMSGMGYVSGYDDGSFKPDNLILRSEFSSIMCRVYDLPIVSDDRYIFFDDVDPNAWYAKYVPSMSFILPVYDDFLFHPLDSLTRFEAAYAMLIIYGCEPAYDNSAAMYMDDYDEFSFDAMVANVVATALENDIMFGRDGRFDPFESLTRAELSTLIVRMVEERGTYFPGDTLTEEMESIAGMLEGSDDYDSYYEDDNYYQDDNYYSDYEEDTDYAYEDFFGDYGEDDFFGDYEDDYTENESVSNNQASNATSLELQVLELVNEERAKEGIAPLVWDDALASVAKAHSEDMATRGFFDHNNPDGESPFDRMRAYGISYMAAAENIAAGSSTAESVVNQWMNSEGHRNNIMNPDYTKLGVGMAKGGSYGTYWTQCFTD